MTSQTKWRRRLRTFDRRSIRNQESRHDERAFRSPCTNAASTQTRKHSNNNSKSREANAQTTSFPSRDDGHELPLIGVVRRSYKQGLKEPVKKRSARFVRTFTEFDLCCRICVRQFHCKSRTKERKERCDGATSNKNSIESRVFPLTSAVTTDTLSFCVIREQTTHNSDVLVWWRGRRRTW